MPFDDQILLVLMFCHDQEFGMLPIEPLMLAHLMQARFLTHG